MSKNSTNAKPVNKLLVFTGLAGQMIVTLVLFAYAGQWLDHKFGLKTPWCTVVMCLLGLSGIMFLLVRTLSKINEEP